jgi:RHS repeat-associated protein
MYFSINNINNVSGLVAFKVTNPTRTVYYLQTDYQGSLVAVYSNSGAVYKQFSYDPCGRRRNATDWNDYSVTSETLFTRGYTGHEHLDNFGLINMNGRVYDPRLGRFLSPDNYVQSPTNSQSYNRYSYCINNPMKYTDPSGDFFIGFIAGVVEAICNGGLDPTINKERRHEAWSKADPTLKGTRANNAWRLGAGMFKWDTQRGGNNRAWKNIWQVSARFSPWEAFSTAEGYFFNDMFNTFGEVDKVEYYHGATVMYADQDHYPNLTTGGMTLGNYIFINSDIASHNITDNNNHLLMHEFGHTLQYHDFGIFGVNLEANSLFANVGLSSVDANATWWEEDANARSLSYLRGYLNENEINSWLNDSEFKGHFTWGGGKWGRYYLSYLWPGLMFWQNVINSGN